MKRKSIVEILVGSRGTVKPNKDDTPRPENKPRNPDEAEQTAQRYETWNEDRLRWYQKESK